MTDVEVMKDKLSQLGFDKRRLRGKSIEELKELQDNTTKAEEALETAIVTDTIEMTPIEETSVESTPSFSDPNWTDYVMGLFDEKELDKKSKMPRVDGLRRIALKLCGPYDMVVQEIPQLPSRDNGGRATAVVQLKFHSDKRVVSDAADVYDGNTDSRFAVHAVAIAVTRAEGRALRKALFLTRILAAEELYGPNGKIEEDEPYVAPQKQKEGSIQETMINSLFLMCDKQNVDLHKVAVDLGFDIASPKDLTHEQGLKVANQLSLYQRKAIEVPEQVKK
jgi:hypothetical protein